MAIENGIIKVTPTSGISVNEVSLVTGTPSLDIGTLCTSDNINIYSKFKPIEARGKNDSQGNPTEIYSKLNESDYSVRNYGISFAINAASPSTKEYLIATNREGKADIIDYYLGGQDITDKALSYKGVWNKSIWKKPQHTFRLLDFDKYKNLTNPLFKVEIPRSETTYSKEPIPLLFKLAVNEDPNIIPIKNMRGIDMGELMKDYNIGIAFKEDIPFSNTQNYYTYISNETLNSLTSNFKDIVIDVLPPNLMEGKESATLYMKGTMVLCKLYTYDEKASDYNFIYIPNSTFDIEIIRKRVIWYMSSKLEGILEPSIINGAIKGVSGSGRFVKVKYRTSDNKPHLDSPALARVDLHIDFYDDTGNNINATLDINSDEHTQVSTPSNDDPTGTPAFILDNLDNLSFEQYASSIIPDPSRPYDFDIDNIHKVVIKLKLTDISFNTGGTGGILKIDESDYNNDWKWTFTI